MADIATKFGLGGSAGPHFTDATWFQKTLAVDTTIYIRGIATTRTSQAAEFWTAAIAARGVADDTNWTADTYKTIANISGAGLLYDAIGPAGLAGTPTTTMRITVDGVAYTIAETATTTAHRLILGACFISDSTGAAFTVAANFANGVDSINAGKTAQTVVTNGVWITDIGFMSMMGTPALYFGTSLLVEMKSSETNSTTTNRERSSGLIYRKFS